MWTNRETQELYEHLSGPVGYSDIAVEALDEVRSDPELWGDFERQAVHTLCIRLRPFVENTFEDFYFGPETARSPRLARMCTLWGLFGA